MSPFSRLAAVFTGRVLLARGSLITPSNTITTVFTLPITAVTKPRCLRFAIRGQADSANQAHWHESKVAVRRIGENATAIVQSVATETSLRDGSPAVTISLSTNDLLFRITGTLNVSWSHDWRVEEEVW